MSSHYTHKGPYQGAQCDVDLAIKIAIMIYEIVALVGKTTFSMQSNAC